MYIVGSMVQAVHGRGLGVLCLDSLIPLSADDVEKILLILTCFSQKYTRLKQLKEIKTGP